MYKDRNGSRAQRRDKERERVCRERDTAKTNLQVGA